MTASVLCKTHTIASGLSGVVFDLRLQERFHSRKIRLRMKEMTSMEPKVAIQVCEKKKINLSILLYPFSLMVTVFGMSREMLSENEQEY